MRGAKILQTQTKGAHVMFCLALGIMVLICLLACWCMVNTEVSDYDEQ